MISKNEVKYIQSLSRKKNRDAEGVFIAETPKLIDELLQSDLIIQKIYATQNWKNESGKPVNIQQVSEAELARISRLETPNKVVAVMEKKNLPPFYFDSGITLVLDGIQDPGNLGTIIRIADWFGLSQMLLSKDTADCYNPKTVQSSMGSIARIHIWYDDIEPLLATAAKPMYGAVLSGQNIAAAGKVQTGILLIGNEGNGIRANLLPYIQHTVTIPRIGGAESLNAAVATGILLSHLIQLQPLASVK